MPAKKERMFALYWDESDEWDDSYSKVRRALFNTQEEAIAQATHDLLCLRCRVLDNGRTTLECTGIEPLDAEGERPCAACGGSKLTPSRRILRVEEFYKDDVKKFHVESKGVAEPVLPEGKSVWTPDDLKV